MKRSTCFDKAFSGYAVPFMCFIAWLAAAPVQSKSTEYVAVIIKLKGTVQIQKPDQGQWEKATKGQTLGYGTRVKTGTDGLAMLKFLSDGSMFRMKSETSIALAKEDDTEVTGDLGMEIGSAFFTIDKQTSKNRFIVTTPTTVATIKGTKFWVIVDTNAVTRVVVTAGTVSVKNVPSNQIGDVGQGYTAFSDSSTLEIRKTTFHDIPADEALQELEFEFEGPDGKKERLKIEYDEIEK